MANMSYRKTIMIRATGIWRGTLLAILLFCSPVLHAHTFVLVKNKLFCDEEKKLCIQGWIAYENHFNTIRVDARLAERSVPGTISLRFSGTTRAGEAVSARLEFRIDGRYQEIIKASIVPDAPSRTHWTMSVFYFTADK